MFVIPLLNYYVARYAINCKVCEKEVALVKIGSDYQCPTCLSMYDDEHGVMDLDEFDDMHRLYRGAKIAGLIKDEETYEEFYHD